MRPFQVIIPALLAIMPSSNAGLITESLGSGILGGLSYAPASISPFGNTQYTVGAPTTISGFSSYAPASVSYGNALSTISSSPVSYSRVISSPTVSTFRTISAPSSSVISSGYASPVISSVAPVSLGFGAVPTASAVNVIGSAGSSVRTHELHTGSGTQAIRIEDFQAGDQVIRVHEGAQAAPEIAQVAVPGDQHHVRVVQHASGPAQVERVVSRGPTQVVDIEKPGRPSARIIQVVKAQSPAPTVEFVDAGSSSHHVYIADDVQSGGSIGSSGLIGGSSIVSGAVPALSTLSVAPVSPIVSRSVAIAPAVSGIIQSPAVTTRVIAAPAVSGVIATPVHHVIAAPVATSHAVVSSPVVSYATHGLGGFHYGGLGYSTGYNPYSIGSNSIFLDSKKKASAKKSA